jgi:uncharacterized membrane protein (DUF2068 family)
MCESYADLGELLKGMCIGFVVLAVGLWFLVLGAEFFGVLISGVYR